MRCTALAKRKKQDYNTLKYIHFKINDTCAHDKGDEGMYVNMLK